MDPQVKIVIVNAKKILFTGSKMQLRNGKKYYHHTGYPGGIKETAAVNVLKSAHPQRVLKSAISGMLKRNKLRKELLSNLYIYPEAEHPHTAQQPAAYDFGAQNRKNIAF